ncbi:hypothetical protein ACHAW5_009109 [Stephanodiscus triporus]|uniref:Uncharacterized protein n=1 Tax=Stephanodiscus triporus TaxID=2934178 RepID=A0ABD3QE31_9STRA
MTSPGLQRISPQLNICCSTHHLRHSKKNVRNSSPLSSSLRSSATSASVHHREFSSSENTDKPGDANEVSITPSLSLAYKDSARLRPQALRQLSEALLKLPAVSIRTSVLVRCRQLLTPSLSLASKDSARLRPQAPRQLSEALLKLPAARIRTSVLFRCRQFLTPSLSLASKDSARLRPQAPRRLSEALLKSPKKFADHVRRRGREIDERIRLEREMANKLAKKSPKKLPNKLA